MMIQLDRIKGQYSCIHRAHDILNLFCLDRNYSTGYYWCCRVCCDTIVMYVVSDYSSLLFVGFFYFF